MTAHSIPRAHGAVLLAAIVLLGTVVPPVGLAGANSAPAAGGTITVPGDYATIQAAVDNASAGDVIEVENGTYSEVVAIGKDLTLTNATGASPVVAFPGGSPIQSAVVITNGPATVEISGFTIEGHPSKHGIGSYSSSSLTVRDVRIEGADYGIEATTSSEPLVVENVEVENVTMGALVEGAGSLRATGLAVNDTDAHGVVVRDDGNATLVDSSVENASLSGLFVFDGASVDLDGTVVESSGEDALLVDGATANVSGGVFDGPVRYNASTGTVANATVAAGYPDSGVHVLNGSTVEIRDSAIASSDAAGVVAGAGSTLALLDSDVDAASFALLDHDGGDLTAERNTFDAAVFAGGSGSATLVDNEFVVGGTYAVKVDGRQGTVFSNEIRSDSFGPVDYGIYVNGTSASVGYNTINGTGLDAIRFADTQGGVTFNDLSNTSLDERVLHPANRVTAAVTADGASHVEIRENDVDDAYGGGIRLDLAAGIAGSSMRVVENEINRTGTDGIFVLGPAGNPTVRIRNNTVSGVGATNATGGAYAEGVNLVGSADGEVVDNVVVDADTSGISVSVPGPVPIRGNTVLDSGSNGIEVETGSTNVTDNYVRGGQDGIDVAFEARSNVTGNVVADAGAAVRVASSGWVETLRYNDLSGGQDYAVENENQSAVDASLNYFGPSGPATVDFDGPVAVDPFLTEPPSQVDRGDLKAFGYNLHIYDDHVYAFGTPAPLERTLDETFTDFDGAVYLYDEASGSWELATGDETLDAMEAVVVVPNDDTRAVVEFSDATPVRPTTRDLEPGWNFVAPRSYETARPALADSINTETDLLAPFAQPHGQPAPPGESFAVYSYAEVLVDDPRVSPFTGYFLYVTESGEIPGHVADGTTLSELKEALNLGTSGD